MRLALLFSLALGALFAAEPPQAGSFETTLQRRVGYRYLQFKPTRYDAAPDHRWPLLLFLHGAGERGDDIQRLTRHGPPKLLHPPAALTDAEKIAAAALAENFLVIAPQCPAGRIWDEEALLALLDDATARLRIDPDRVYVTGLSMGGYGTWSLLARAPERFVAVVPICGGGRTIDFFVSGGSKSPYRNVAVWAFHGAKDPIVPVLESQNMIAACRRAGMKNLELTLYPEAAHDSWTETYADARLYAWLLQQRR